MSRCPHARIQDCPLYVAAHYTTGHGCVGDLHEPCLVAQGKLPYQTQAAKAYAAHPELWAEKPPAIAGRMQ